MRWISILASVAVAGMAPERTMQAPAPETVIEVRLSSFAFTPDRLVLKAGEHQTLRLIGMEDSHNFAAPALFRTSRVDAAVSRLVHRGVVEVREGDVIDIGLTPGAPGVFSIRCTHLLHTTYGMKGEAVVR